MDTFLRKCRSIARNPNAPVWERNASVLSITFVDVGEGDCIVIVFPDKQTWLLDAGGLHLSPSSDEGAYVFDIGEGVVSRYLWQEWVPRLDRLILSHSDQDHAGGIPAVMKNFRVTRLGYSHSKPDPLLSRILSIAGEKQIPIGVLQAGVIEQIGAVTVHVLHPHMNSSLLSSNENSIVLRLSYGRFSALFTGDLEKAGERELLSAKVDLHSELLKVAHHGSKWGSSHELMARVRPRWAVVSAGQGNPFGHPSAEVMARLRQHKVQSFLTQNEGAITFQTDGNRYVLRGHVRGLLNNGELY